MKFIPTTHQRTRLELVVDFNESVSLLEAKRVLRQLVESMQITVNGFETPSSFAGATLRSDELKQILPIQFKINDF